MPNIIAFEADFHVQAQISSLVRKSIRAGWKKIVQINRSGQVIDVDLEQEVDTASAGWSALSREGRPRDFCSKVSKEIADSVYRGGRYAGNWFIPASSRGVRRAAWDLCETPQKCETAPWGHASSLVPYPYLFLQTGSVGQDCVPNNRLSRGSGPGVWIAHFRGVGDGDWKLRAAFNFAISFSANCQFLLDEIVKVVPSWGEWSPSKESVCSGHAFVQKRVDLNGNFRPQVRKAFGESLEDCEYGAVWVDAVLDPGFFGLFAFEAFAGIAIQWAEKEAEFNGAAEVGAQWGDLEPEFLPVGEGDSMVFVG